MAQADRAVGAYVVAVLDRGGAETVSLTLAARLGGPRRGAARSVTWHPHGNRIAVTSNDGTLDTWDALSATPLTEVAAHAGSADAVAWSPDGSHIATGGADSACRVWNEVGLVERRVLIHPDRVRSVAWSPDSTRLATAADDGRLRVWSIADGAQIDADDDLGAAVRTVAWSPTGRYIAAGGTDGWVRVFEAGLDGRALGEPVSAWNGPTRAPVLSVTWSPDGSRVAAALDDGMARIWQVGIGQPIRELTGHTGAVRSVSWAPDGRLIATAGADGEVLLWDAGTGREVRRVPGSAPSTQPTQPTPSAPSVEEVRWSPSGSELAIAGGDGVVRSWSPDADPHMATLAHPTHPVLAVAWSADGGRLAAGGDDSSVRTWDVQRRTPLTAISGLPHGTISVSWSPEGRDLAVGDVGTIRVWDARFDADALDRNQVRHLGNKEGWYRGVAWDPGGNLVAGANADGTVTVFDPFSGREADIDLRHAGRANCVAFSPDGSLLASGGDDGAIRVRHRSTGGEARSHVNVDQPVQDISWSPDGTTIAAAGGTPFVTLLASADGSVRFVDAGSAVQAVGWSADGELLTGTDDGAVSIWNPDTGALLASSVAPGSGPVRALACSDDGRTIATGDDAGFLALWELSRSPDLDRADTSSSTDDVAGDDGEQADPSDRAVSEVPFVDDRPALVDELGRDAVVAYLAHVVETLGHGAGHGRPATAAVHLGGSWGSGKSSIVQFLLAWRRPSTSEAQAGGNPRAEGPRGSGQLGDNGSTSNSSTTSAASAASDARAGRRFDEDWIVVQFDAWRHSRVAPAWWSLATELRRAITRGRPARTRLWLRSREACARLRRMWAFLLAGAAAVFLALLWGFSAFEPLDGTMTAAISVLATVLLVGNFVFWDAPVTARIHQRTDDNPMEEVAQQFLWLRRNGPVGRGAEPTPILFVIDDLDRCDAAYVSALLASVQTLMVTPADSHPTSRRSSWPRGTARRSRLAPLVFLVSADGSWLRAAYESEHECFTSAVGQPGRPLGYLFLEKLFEVSARLPQLSPAQLDHFLGRVLAKDAANGTRPQVSTGRSEGAAPGAAERVHVTAATPVPGSGEHVPGRSAALASVLAAPTEDLVGGDLDHEIALLDFTDRAVAERTRAERLSTPEAMEAVERHLLTDYRHLFEPNPRAVKRTVMTFGVNSTVARTLQLPPALGFDEDAVARWTLLEQRWPELAELIVAHDGRLPADLAPDLAAVVASPPYLRLVQGLTAERVQRVCGLPGLRRQIEALAGKEVPRRNARRGHGAASVG